MTQLEMLPRDGDVNTPHRARLPDTVPADVLACFACGWWTHDNGTHAPRQHRPGSGCPNCRDHAGTGVLAPACLTLTRRDPS